jgi:hypothetical protein
MVSALFDDSKREPLVFSDLGRDKKTGHQIPLSPFYTFHRRNATVIILLANAA